MKRKMRGDAAIQERERFWKKMGSGIPSVCRGRTSRLLRQKKDLRYFLEKIWLNFRSLDHGGGTG